MPDPTPEPNASVTTSPAAASTTETAPVFNWTDKDGNLQQGWRDRIPEEFRGEKCLETVTSIPGMMKTFVYMQKMKGKDTVAVPNDKSPQVDWDTFYDATGRPKTKDDYKWDKPKDIPDELWDKEGVDKFRELAWQTGLSQKHVDAIHDFEVERLNSAIAAEARARETAKTEAIAALKSKWGDAYEERMHLANAFIARTANDTQKEYLLELAGNNPGFIDWCAEWGLKTEESKGIDTSQFRKTPKQAEDRMSELRATPGFINGELKKTDPYRFQKILDEIAEIARTIVPAVK